MTIKLFQRQPYLKECDAKIIDVTENGLILDQTIFFPTGGGQPCDLGTINGLHIVSVKEIDKKIYHLIEIFATKNEENLFQIDQQVHCVLDWNRRFGHMQNHCGEHILSGIFHRLYGGTNRGFHMGNEYMTIDIDGEKITLDMAEKAELAANEVIYRNEPVSVRYFDSKDEAESISMRKSLKIDEEISIVCVGFEENPSDCVACCGTHPKNAGEVGIIKIIKVESYKGMSRIYFKAGKQAFLDYQNKNNILKEICINYSANENNLLEAIKIQNNKTKELRKELKELKKSLV